MFVKWIHLPLLTYTIISLPLETEGRSNHRFFHPGNFTNLEIIVSCVNQTAVRLFNPDRRVYVVRNADENLVDDIARAFGMNAAIFVVDGPMEVKNERIPGRLFDFNSILQKIDSLGCHVTGYIVIENDQFPKSRAALLPGRPVLRTLQYLFVTKTGRGEVLSFARDLRNAGYRDVAFLVFDVAAAATGTVIRARSTDKGITLRSVGSCSSFVNDVQQIPPFATDARLYCPRGGCSVKYGMVADETVRFWRKEDTLKLKRNDTLQSVGSLLVEHFGDHHNISIDSRAGNSMAWGDGIAKLINRDIDVIIGPRLGDLNVLLDMEIVCWYMYRDMVFAGLVRVKTIENDLLSLLMPFHYLVWICVVVLLVVYILLLAVLQRLSCMGLIKEHVKFEYVCTITLGQGIIYPKNFGLKLVMLLWMVFALFLSTTYNSTFTSSLAEVETEDLLKNLEQVRDSGQPLGGPAIILSYFNDSTERSIKELYHRYKVVEPEEALEIIFSKKGLAVLQHFTVDRMNWDYRDNRSLRLYSLSKPVFRFPVFLYSRRGYIYRRPLRQLVTRYREVGMIQKLENVFLIEEDKHIAIRQSSDEILTIKHLRPIFELFFMCQGISVLILIVELMQVRLLKTS